MNDVVFAIFITCLSIAVLVIVVIIAVESVRYKKDKRYRRELLYMRAYKDGYTLSDEKDLYKANQILYITSDSVSFSDTGINGTFKPVWRLP